MQTFTKNELTWVVGELDKLACQYRQEMNNPEITKIEAGLLKLRSEQLAGISDRLSAAVKNGDKRIEIKY